MASGNIAHHQLWAARRIFRRVHPRKAARPRLNLVWEVDPHTSAHAGYSRYFTPPTLQYISTGRIDPFRNTTNAPETYASAPPRSERAHYFDVGVSREF